MKSTKEQREFLNKLRDSGKVNMYGAGVNLMIEYPELDKYEAREILDEWMNEYSKK